MTTASQARPIRHGLAEDRQADAAHESHVHNPSVAETRSAEIYAACAATAGLGRQDQVLSCCGVWEEAEHERLKEARVRSLGRPREVNSAGGVGGLLEESAGRGKGEHVDGDPETLCGKDGVHGWDVLGAVVRAGDEDEDARGERAEGRGCCAA